MKLPFKTELYRGEGHIAMRAVIGPGPGKALETVHQRQHDGPQRLPLSP